MRNPAGFARPRARRAARTGLLALTLLAGCAAPGSEVHVAPFYARHATARGTLEREALLGMLHEVRDAQEGTLLAAAVRPFYGWENLGGGEWRADILPPLGLAQRREDEVLSFVVPFYLYRIGDKVDGTREARMAMLPGFLFRNNSERGLSFGWFPFFGKLEQFLTYEDVSFVLWPLFVRARAGERQSTHVPWPLLGWTRGGGESSFHLLPFYAHAEIEGRYERSAYLWPFFQIHHNRLGGGGEEPEEILWIWPFYGRKTRGTYRADTVLWPLFGYARDPRGDYRAFDATPLVRFEKGGLNTPVRARRRVWPFFGYVEADRMVYRTYLWPLIHVRQESYNDSERESFYALPFWQSWDRREFASGRESAWRKLWPLFQWEREDSLRRGSFPSLDPWTRNHQLTYHYGWIWRLWSYETDPEEDLTRQRAWLDLYRREKDAGEDRRSLSGLWARRDYRDEGGRAIRETSLLFGLLRWRKTEGEAFDMLSPAFPGPGWPAERALAAGSER